MMKVFTSAELAILTLIAERPRHGYEIEQLIDKMRQALESVVRVAQRARHRIGIGRPGGEERRGSTVDDTGMGAELLVDAGVRSFVEEIQVVVTQK